MSPMDQIGRRLSEPSRAFLRMIVRSETLTEAADALLARSRVVSDEANEQIQRSKAVLRQALTTTHGRRGQDTPHRPEAPEGP